MSFWTFAHFLSLTIYAQLTIYVLYKNFRSPLNRACAGILVSFGLWSLGAIPRHGDAFSRQAVVLMTEISAPGWLSFSTFGVVFIMIFADRLDLLRKKWVLTALFLPPILFTYLQWFRGAFLDAYVKTSYGWDALWSSSIWVKIFSLYYAGLMSGILWMLYTIIRRSPNRTLVTQARIIALTCLFPFIVSSITNVLLPQLFEIYRFAAMGDLFTLTFAFGIVYAVVKYSFMITPALAAEKIVSTMSESLLLLNPDGTIATVNKAAVDLLGYGAEELEGKSLQLLSGDGTGGGSLAKNVSAGGSLSGERVNLLRRSGERVPVLFSSGPLLDDFGDLIGIVCLARDITDLRKSEEDRRNLAKMQEREEVCRWLHDHLGADLYNISLLSELTMDRLQSDPVLTKELVWISETSKDALSSIRNYLDFANNTGFSLSDLALRMEEYGRLLFQSSDIQFSCDWDFGNKDRVLSPIKGFSVFLIFKESVTNILKHAEARKVKTVLAAGRENFELRIEDDGKGYVPGRTVAAGHQGITNISAWADKVGGSLTVAPLRERGTVVRLQVPH